MSSKKIVGVKPIPTRGNIELYSISLSVNYKALQSTRVQTGLTHCEVSILLGYDLAFQRLEVPALCLADMEKLSGIHAHPDYYRYAKKLTVKGYLEAVSRYTYSHGKVSTRYALTCSGKRVVAFYQKQFGKFYELYREFAKSDEIPYFQKEGKKIRETSERA